MEVTVLSCVDRVLNARDVLLSANIRVVGYDYYPNGAGSLRVFDDDSERAVAALTAGGIRFTTESPIPAYPFVSVWPSKT